MKYKKLLLLILAGTVLSFCSCTPIPRIQCSIPAYGFMEKQPAELAVVVFSAAPYPGTLPIPADRLMLFMQKTQVGIIPEFYFPEDGCSLITEYNRYAAKKIFSGASFDPIRERQQFLNQKAGNAAKILLEYFRVIERRTLFAYSSAKMENRLPGIHDLYHTDTLVLPEQILKKGMNRKVYSAKEVAVIRKELEFFQNCRKTIQQLLLKEVPTVFAGDGTWHELNLRAGKKATLKAGFRVDISPDKKAGIIRISAEEPEMAARKITGTERDYKSAWGDDCFEIFLAPDAATPGKCFQFIITSDGVLWDTKFEKVSPVHDLSWNTTGTCQVERKAASWEITLTIPWKDFGYDQIPRKPFLFNVYRYRVIKGKKPVSYAWRPIKMGGNFQPEKFGYLVWRTK